MPRGTFWYPFVLVGHSHPHSAPQSSTLQASISLVQLRAGGGRSFTSANFVSVGKDWIHEQKKTRGKLLGKLLLISLQDSVYLWVYLSLTSLHFPYRSVRFRWYQGFFSTGSAPPTWALDNVYIGPQCQDMCNGHGACVGGTHCECDPGYSGPDCSVPDTPNPDFLKEDFEGTLKCRKIGSLLKMYMY